MKKSRTISKSGKVQITYNLLVVISLVIRFVDIALWTLFYAEAAIKIAKICKNTRKTRFLLFYLICRIVISLADTRPSTKQIGSSDPAYIKNIEGLRWCWLIAHLLLRVSPFKVTIMGE